MRYQNIAATTAIVGGFIFASPIPSTPVIIARTALTAELTRTVSDSLEIALGAALATQFEIDRGIVPSPESDAIEAYLQTIADSLGRYARRSLRWKIHYDPHPGIKSAVALPGGHILIWGGVLAYMSTTDEVAAVIAHEIEHIDDGQVSRRIDSLITTKHRDIRSPHEWIWEEFGDTYGAKLENLCDYKGAKLVVLAGYSPYGLETLLESFVALGKVHSPSTPVSRAIIDRIEQIQNEIITEHWEALKKTHPLHLPGTGD